MKARFILQGLDPASPQVGPEVAASFKDSAFEEFSGLVAFVSNRGANILATLARTASGRMRRKELVVGVDQGGTSVEALRELLGSGIEVRVFYTPSPSIFHPKVYLFHGPYSGRLIVGSSNLTVPGWFTNLEASAVLDLDLKARDDAALLASVEMSLGRFRGDASSPLQNLADLSGELIDELAAAGVIPAESSRHSPDTKGGTSDLGAEERVAPAVLRRFPKMRLPSVPSGLRPTVPPMIRIAPVIPTPTVVPAPAPRPISAAIAAPVPSSALRGPLVWRKAGLPASDVQFEKAGTSPTGGLRLTQAKWQVGGRTIDQTRYFRNDVFRGYPWVEVRSRPRVELTRVKFRVIVLGSDLGEHILEIRHKPSGEAGQGNYTTLISWGPVGSHFAGHDLRGRTVNLYGPPAGTTEPFEIEIA